MIILLTIICAVVFWPALFYFLVLSFELIDVVNNLSDSDYLEAVIISLMTFSIVSISLLTVALMSIATVTSLVWALLSMLIFVIVPAIPTGLIKLTIRLRDKCKNV